MAGPSIFFEDFAAGQTRNLGARTVTAEEIVAFASQWDPQPFHTDAQAAEDGPFGELSASGWHTTCVMMRTIYDGLLRHAASLGAPGVEEVRWARPVLAGDTLAVRCIVLETRASRSRPAMGFVRFRYEAVNQRGETAMTMENFSMFGRRDAKAGA